ncbi:hypothetical protein BD626DRAFT_506094 [Schizophyllum amplum]|uniref:Uncharacterized protein n=1 Tax=Schizophyllum amplum TaxID=97359 RepID=A0A550C5B2_9AGAR|nr:hypothetical protein BD626DRAFT_506094 [Auriculariopsis ampla]
MLRRIPCSDASHAPTHPMLRRIPCSDAYHASRLPPPPTQRPESKVPPAPRPPSTHLLQDFIPGVLRSPARRRVLRRVFQSAHGAFFRSHLKRPSDPT